MTKVHRALILAISTGAVFIFLFIALPEIDPMWIPVIGGVIMGIGGYLLETLQSRSKG